MTQSDSSMGEILLASIPPSSSNRLVSFMAATSSAVHSSASGSASDKDASEGKDDAAAMMGAGQLVKLQML